MNLISAMAAVSRLGAQWCHLLQHGVKLKKCWISRGQKKSLPWSVLKTGRKHSVEVGGGSFAWSTKKRPIRLVAASERHFRYSHYDKIIIFKWVSRYINRIKANTKHDVSVSVHPLAIYMVAETSYFVSSLIWSINRNSFLKSIHYNYNYSLPLQL